MIANRTFRVTLQGCKNGLSICVLALVASGLCRAQEPNGLITGTITDPSGAVVAGAHVTAANTATNVRTTTVTNTTGNYSLLYLIPGNYTITVERDGFTKLFRAGIEVRVGDELKIDLTLEVGSVQQTIDVEAKAPLLQAESADVGDTINHSEVEDLPLADGNPFLLARLVPGAVFTGNPQFTRPFDNGDVSAIRVNGAEGSNEFTLNGMSNTGVQLGFGNRVVAFVPPSDAIQEFKITTSSFSALTGHSAASTIDVSTKSGTNSLHGTAYEFLRNEAFSANNFFLNRTGLPNPRVRYNRFGGTLGGPVWLPKIYNGRSKTFFFVAVEGIKDAFPEAGTFTVPTVAERKGDFSALLPGIQIFDPLTGALGADGHVHRSAFRNNIIPPERLDAIALNVLQFYPLPNAAGRADGTNNFVSPQTRTDSFHTELARVDHVLGSKQRLSGTLYSNWRRESRFDWAGRVNGVNAAGQDLFLVNHGISLDDVVMLGPTTLLALRGGFTRFQSEVAPPTLGFDPARLGFSSSVLGLFAGSPYVPPFNISGYTRLSHNTGNAIFQSIFSNVYSFVPMLTTIKRSHTLNFGYDFRAYRENFGSVGNSEGFYDFQDNYTSAADNASGQMGQGLAAFMLGQPTGGSTDRNGSRANQALSHGGFIQDVWKASRRLMLSVGLRYDYEGATTERFNRNIRGFDLSDPNPIQTAAAAAFVKNFPNGLVVIPGKPAISASNFSVLGGFLFADADHRGFWNPDWRNFQPRFGFAYQVALNTVVRGGWAIYSVPLFVAGINQTGFSQTTQLVPSNDNGLTFQANLANPFPGGVLNPPGLSLGLATGLGQNVSFLPVNVKTGHSQRWSVEIQRELPGRWLIDLAYVGSHGYDLARSSNYLDAVPSVYLSTSPIRDNATISALTKQVPNPFFGLVPGSSMNTAKTIQAIQLLRPFPEFTQISTTIYNGTNSFNAAEVRVQHRFNHGFSLFAAYTWSKLLERFGFLNDFETSPTKRLSGNDVPHRFTLSSVYELPFGRGRRWGKEWHGVIQEVLGGWQAGGIFQVQTGEPIGMGNIVYFGDPNKLRTHINSSTLDHAFDTSGFYFTDALVQRNGVVDPNLQRADARINLADNVRTFPNILGNFRGQGQNNVDLLLMKKFFIKEKTNLQLRAVALNAFNHPWFSNPNVDPRSGAFGTITSQRNLPREMELALRLVF